MVTRTLSSRVLRLLGCFQVEGHDVRLEGGQEGFQGLADAAEVLLQGEVARGTLGVHGPVHRDRRP